MSACGLLNSSLSLKRPDHFLESLPIVHRLIPNVRIFPHFSFVPRPAQGVETHWPKLRALLVQEIPKLFLVRWRKNCKFWDDLNGDGDRGCIALAHGKQEEGNEGENAKQRARNQPM